MSGARYPTELAGGMLAGWQARQARYSGRLAVTLFMLVAVVYAIGAELSWHSFGSGLAFGFPPAGVDVAVLLLTARRYWPAVIAAIVVAEVGVDLQHHLTVVGSAAANVVEPLVDASCVLWWCRGRS